MLDNIGFYTMSEDRVKQASVISPLWRCELVLTDRCNFKCPYCRGLKDDCKKDIDIEVAKRIINYWGDNNLKNIRFSGGEPTLHPHLSEIVMLSRERGIKRIAISTNGSADLEYYKELVYLGVNDFSISLDACCSSYGEVMSGGVKGSWEILTKNIEELSKLTYVTVGIVLTDDNIKDAKDIIRFADKLGVSDIRVISAAQYNKSCTVLHDTDIDLCNKHPILKYRSNNYKNDIDIRGLSIADNSHCPLVLDDMAISGNCHFPCIIYMREHGDAIGNIDNLSSIRNDRKIWSENHNVLEDKICKKNCLDVCRQYNNRWRDCHGK